MINNIKDHIIVKDNFFNDEVYKEIIKDISTLKFKNRSIDAAIHGNKSVYQKIYFEVPLNHDHFAVQEVNKLLNNYGFDLISSPLDHAYLLSTKHEEATPHYDDKDLNCLVYLKGNEIINSGTGFYDKKEEDYVLNRHIGFKENRAIIFDSKIFHASLQFNEGAGVRYVMVNFFNYRGNVL